MIECGGVFLPDGEMHLVDWMTKKDQRVDGKLTYQLDKQNLALSCCRNFRTAIDVGAHVGLWSMNLVKRFAMVHAFEPVFAHRVCFRHNVPPTNVMLHACALGNEERDVSVYSTPGSSGDSWISGKGETPMRKLDSFFEIADVDFIKLDCEGFELFALQGGEQMLKRFRPVICVEQKPGKAQRFGLEETQAVTWLEGLGATLRKKISGDYIMSFEE